jgi:hypothetical protein
MLMIVHVIGEVQDQPSVKGGACARGFGLGHQRTYFRGSAGVEFNPDYLETFARHVLLLQVFEDVETFPARPVQENQGNQGFGFNVGVIEKFYGRSPLGMGLFIRHKKRAKGEAMSRSRKCT